jgi:hypothetical protein
VAERDQRVGDPPGAGAQVEHPGAGAGQPVHQLGLAGRGQPPVDLDRAAVGGDRAAHRKPRTNRCCAGVSTARGS